MSTTMMKNDNSVSDLIDKDWARGSGEETSSLTRGHQYHRSNLVPFKDTSILVGHLLA